MAEPVTQENDALAKARVLAELDQLVKILMAEREKRENEIAEERRWRDREVEQQRQQMEEQMDRLMKLVETAHAVTATGSIGAPATAVTTWER